MRLLLCFIFAACLQASPAHARAAVPSAQAAGEANRLEDIRAANARADSAERARFEAERRQWVLEARKDIEDSSYSRLEILIAILGGLLAILVVVFGLTYGRQAAIAARDEVKKELKDLRNELSTTRTAAAQARTATEQAQAEATATRAEIEKVREEAADLLGRIRQHEREAEQSKTVIVEMAHSVVISGSATPRETAQLSTAAKEIESQPAGAQSSADYQVLIGAAVAAEKWEEARDLADAAMTRFPEDTLLAAFALTAKGYALWQMDHSRESLEPYDTLLARFPDPDQLAIRRHLAMSRYNKGCSLDELGAADEAIATFDDVAERFAASDDPMIGEQVAKSLSNKGVRLVHLGKLAGALTAFEEVIKRFSASEDVALRRQVAIALFGKGWALGELKRTNESIAAYDEAVARFADSDDIETAEAVAKVLYNKAILILNGGSAENAFAVFEEAVNRFAGRDEQALRRQAAMALFEMARLRARQADVGETIRFLRSWSERAGSFDCSAVTRVSGFEPVWTDPAFAALLREMGCLPAEPGERDAG